MEINKLTKDQTIRVRINSKGDGSIKGEFLFAQVLEVKVIQENNPNIIVKVKRSDGRTEKLSFGGGIDRT